MSNSQSVLQPLVQRLQRHGAISQSGREALLGLPVTVKTVASGSHIVRDGDKPDSCALLLSGFAFRLKLTAEGARQIISVHMPTEILDLQNLFLDSADTGVQTLTEAEIAFIPRAAIRELALTRADVGRILWIDTLIDASIFREWVVNVGRRDARTRVAHLLCEFSLRLERHGLAMNHRYELPMTQEQLADAVGLTSVHVNRVLRTLEEEKLIRRDKRSIVIEDWERMRGTADFSERYLHHDAVPV